MAEYEFHYTRFPALAAYIDRVGAEQINFKRFMIKDYRGKYYVERVLIRIEDDRTISCSVKEHAPTKEEAEAIADELKKVEFPRSVAVAPGEAEEFLRGGQIYGEVYTFYDSARTRVIMLQERREDAQGKKYYVPWTPFSQVGKPAMWRMMEPDGRLPLWKPASRRDLGSYMIHEGAKTAAFVDGLVNDPERRDELARHPWGRELAGFEHWGAIGGALATHRIDYDEIRRENIEGDLVYVCDNDPAGKEAVTVFSRCYGGKLYSIKFEDRFPSGWDLADKMPPAMLNKSGSCRLRLVDMMGPATWATTAIASGKRGGVTYKLTPHFEQEWCHTIDPEMWCHTRFTHLCFIKQSQFDSIVRPFSDVEFTSRLLRQSYQNKVVTVKYDPGKRPGLYHTEDKETFLNLYVPSSVQDYTRAEARAVDYRLFVKFLENLLPRSAEREQVAKWIATLIACPGTKMNYGLLLISQVQGVGKTTLANIAAKILGNQGNHANAIFTGESSIVGRFSGWAQKQLVVVNEIYAGHSTAAYDKLKEVITDKTIRVERKYVEEYNVDNHVHVIACSNSLRALKLDNTDRRWFVPEVTRVKESEEYWTRLNDWLDEQDGYRKVKQWARDYVKKNGSVLPGSEAPWTPTKREMVEESDSPGMALARSMCQQIMAIYEMDDPAGVLDKNGELSARASELDQTAPTLMRIVRARLEERHVVFFDIDVMDAVREQLYDGRRDAKLEKPLTLRKVAKQEGLEVGEQKVTTTSRHNARVISTYAPYAVDHPNEVLRLSQENGPDSPVVIDIRMLARELKNL